MNINSLKRPTNYPSGIASGGGDTGFDIFPQRTTLVKRISQTTQDIVLPAGTIIHAYVNYPDPLAPAVAGTFAMDDWDIDTDTSNSTVRTGIDATTNLEDYLGGDVTSVVAELITVPVTLATAKRYRFTPTGIGADTYCLAGMIVTLPRIPS